MNSVEQEGARRRRRETIDAEIMDPRDKPGDDDL
jgi:hypothetical protein